MESKNIKQVMSHYLQEMLELYHRDDSPGFTTYYQALKDLLYSALDFLPGNISKDNIEIEINQKLFADVSRGLKNEGLKGGRVEGEKLRSSKRRLKASKPLLHENPNALYDPQHFAAFSADAVHLKKPSGGPKGLIGPPCHGAPGRRRQSNNLQIQMPCIRIWDGKAKIYGYIDVLSPNTTKEEIESYQLIYFYKRLFPNLLLTNFFEFRYYKGDQKVCTARPISVSHIGAISRKVRVTSPKIFLKELQHFMGYSHKKSKDPSFIRLQQQLALKTYYLKEYVLPPVMNHLLYSGAKSDLVRIYRAYCYFFNRQLSIKEFSAFLSHLIIDGFLKACIFHGSVHSNNETPFSRGVVGEFAQFSGMLDRRLALFKYLSLGGDQLLTPVKWMLDDISDLLWSFDFKQMGFDSKNSLVIDGERLQWEGYFFKPYYDTTEDRERIIELLVKEGIFSGNTG